MFIMKNQDDHIWELEALGTPKKAFEKNQTETADIVNQHLLVYLT